MYYLWKTSIEYRRTSESIVAAMNDFKKLNFDFCTCKDKTDKEECINKDTNFQNHLTIIPNEILLLTFMLYPLVCHLIHSFIKSLLDDASSPITLLDFILGPKLPEATEDENVGIEQIPQSSFEMKDMNVTESQCVDDQEVQNTSTGKKSKFVGIIFQSICVCLSVVYVAGIVFTPNLYPYLFEERTGVNGKLGLKLVEIDKM